MGSYEEAKGNVEKYGRYVDLALNKFTKEVSSLFSPTFFIKMEAYNFAKKELNLTDEQMRPVFDKAYEEFMIQKKEAQDGFTKN